MSQSPQIEQSQQCDSKDTELAQKKNTEQTMGEKCPVQNVEAQETDDDPQAIIRRKLQQKITERKQQLRQMLQNKIETQNETQYFASFGPNPQSNTDSFAENQPHNTPSMVAIDDKNALKASLHMPQSSIGFVESSTRMTEMEQASNHKQLECVSPLIKKEGSKNDMRHGRHESIPLDSSFDNSPKNNLNYVNYSTDNHQSPDKSDHDFSYQEISIEERSIKIQNQLVNNMAKIKNLYYNCDKSDAGNSEQFEHSELSIHELESHSSANRKRLVELEAQLKKNNNKYVALELEAEQRRVQLEQTMLENQKLQQALNKLMLEKQKTKRLSPINTKQNLVYKRLFNFKSQASGLSRYSKPQISTARDEVSAFDFSQADIKGGIMMIKQDLRQIKDDFKALGMDTSQLGTNSEARNIKDEFRALGMDSSQIHFNPQALMCQRLDTSDNFDNSMVWNDQLTQFEDILNRNLQSEVNSVQRLTLKKKPSEYDAGLLTQREKKSVLMSKNYKSSKQCGQFDGVDYGEQDEDQCFNIDDSKVDINDNTIMVKGQLNIPDNLKQEEQEIFKDSYMDNALNSDWQESKQGNVHFVHDHLNDHQSDAVSSPSIPKHLVPCHSPNHTSSEFDEEVDDHGFCVQHYGSKTRQTHTNGYMTRQSHTNGYQTLNKDNTIKSIAGVVTEKSQLLQNQMQMSDQVQEFEFFKMCLLSKIINRQGKENKNPKINELNKIDPKQMFLKAKASGEAHHFWQFDQWIDEQLNQMLNNDKETKKPANEEKGFFKKIFSFGD